MSIVAKGRYAPERRAGKNVVLLAPDVAQAFPSDDAVNEALRLVLRIAEVPIKYEPAEPNPGVRNFTDKPSSLQHADA